MSIATLSAQQTAYFETTIYVEDAVGNMDTIVVGHDPEANYTYNPQFGELNIQSPFDSVFEVRAAHEGSFSQSQDITLSKKIISYTDGPFYKEDSCFLYTGSTVLLIHALHQPVTITWDRNTFEESYCRLGSFITSHSIPLAVPDWFLDTAALALSACMAETDHYSATLFDYGDWGFYRMHEIEGAGIDTIYAMLITLGPTLPGSGETPCQGIVSIQDPVQSDTGLQSYPNPASDFIILDTGTDPVVEFEIFDLSGKRVLRGHGSTVDLKELSTGIYLISVVTDAGHREIRKIVKQ